MGVPPVGAAASRQPALCRSFDCALAEVVATCRLRSTAHLCRCITAACWIPARVRAPGNVPGCERHTRPAHKVHGDAGNWHRCKSRMRRAGPVGAASSALRSSAADGCLAPSLAKVHLGLTDGLSARKFSSVCSSMGVCKSRCPCGCQV